MPRRSRLRKASHSSKKSSRSHKSSRSPPKSKVCGKGLSYAGYAGGAHFFKLKGTKHHGDAAYGYETKGGKCFQVTKTQYLLHFKHKRERSRRRMK